MVDGVSFKITGQKELERAFRALGARSNEVVMERLRLAAHSVADRMAAAYSAASGNPVNKIYVKTGISGKGNPYASIIIVPGADRMEFNLEFGTSKIKAIHWIRSTFRSAETKAAAEREIQEAIQQVIKEASVI